jgi:hypothetical protein
MARARCVVAEAEIALVSRDLAWPARALDAARATLDEHGDRVNAAYARYLEVRAGLDRDVSTKPSARSPSWTPRPCRPRRGTVTSFWSRGLRFVVFGHGWRVPRSPARSAKRASPRIPSLIAEVERAYLVLKTPAARLIAEGKERLVLLEEVEALLASKSLVVDACRHVLRHESRVVSLAKRPVLFALAARWVRRGRRRAERRARRARFRIRRSRTNRTALGCASK